jgi:hypothetical protein
VVLGGVGIFVGFLLGARYTLNLVASGRAVRSAGARMAAIMPQTVPSRSAEDILAGRVRIYLGGLWYALPVLPRGPSRRWLESLDISWTRLATALTLAGSDAEQIITVLSTETTALYELLISYDATNVLPPRDEIEETATDAQILQAVLEVWRAAHPLADTVATDARSLSMTPSGQQTS